MALARQSGRNYRRKQRVSTSPEDSDGEFQHPRTPPPPLPLSVAVDVLAHRNSSSLDLGGGGSTSSFAAVPRRVIGDGDEGSEEEAEAEGRRSGEKGGEGLHADPQVSQSLRGPPSGGADKGEVFHNGAKRIGSGIGYNILKSMGWRENTGLGQSSNGIVDPILPTPKPNHLGIGFNPTAAHDAAQEEIRQIQKAKREERDRKIQEKLEKAQAAEEEAIFMRESSVAEQSTSSEHLSAIGARLQGTSLPHHSKPAASQGNKPVEPGQCPHCKQRFDTKHGLKSHVNARHARLLLVDKRQLKKERRHGGRGHDGASKSSRSGGRQSARSLAPLSQDFSVYD